MHSDQEQNQEKKSGYTAAQWLKAFVPEHVKDEAVLLALRLLARMPQISKKTVRAHYKNNCEVWEGQGAVRQAACSAAGFIEHQERLSRMEYGTEHRLLDRLLLGERKLDASCNTCEVIAVSNTLAALNGGAAPESFPRLLMRFERKGIVLYGYFGTSPDHVQAYFEREYETKKLVGENLTEQNLRTLSKQYTVFILTAYNDKADITKEIHTMCITADKGTYRFHNGERGKVCGSLGQAVLGYHHGQGRAICVIGIRRRKESEKIMVEKKKEL